MNFDTITDWNQTNEAIAAQIGCCDRTVRNARRARGLPRAPARTIRTDLKEKLPRISYKAWEAFNNRQMAKVLGCSVTSIRLFRITNNKPACVK